MECDETSKLPILSAERIELADGRYLIYYTFENESEEIAPDEDAE